jgi:hypothetical protein
MAKTKTGALIIDFVAQIYDVSHVNAGDYFDDEALQYMIERSGLAQDTDSDVAWVFADSEDEVVAYLKDRRIKLA